MDQIHKDGIIPGERGILKKGENYFHSPTAFAKENLFYALWGNEYHCDRPYQVTRAYLNAFLLFRVLDGKLCFDYRSKKFEACSGDVVFLDCKIPHHYHAEGKVHFEYIHFSGNVTQQYFDMLFEKFGSLFSGKLETSFLFRYILSELALPVPNDHKLSFLLHDIISILALPTKKQFSPCVIAGQEFIHNNFREPITVSDIAMAASLSQYHFSRIFKKETAFAPHNYLVNVRLKHAKTLLLETAYSVEQIASLCGFFSTSHFIRAFKKEMDFSPTVFRKLFVPGGFGL